MKITPFSYGQNSPKKEKVEGEGIKIVKKKSVSAYTFNDVVQNI